MRENVTLRDVFAELKAKYDSADNFRSVLVLDAENRLLGTLGVHDLLHALLPDYLQQTPTRYEGGAGDISSLATLWQEDCREQLPSGSRRANRSACAAGAGRAGPR